MLILNYLACGLYLVVALALARAGGAAARRRLARAYLAIFAALAAVFVLLAISRALQLEQLATTVMRSQFSLHDYLERRRDFQRPVVAALVAFAGIGAMAAAYIGGKLLRNRADLLVLIAVTGTCGMIALALLRSVSLHQIDVLLYGPLKLNWIADPALSLLVGTAAILFVRDLARPPAARHRQPEDGRAR